MGELRLSGPALSAAVGSCKDGSLGRVNISYHSYCPRRSFLIFQHRMPPEIHAKMGLVLKPGAEPGTFRVRNDRHNQLDPQSQRIPTLYHHRHPTCAITTSRALHHTYSSNVSSSGIIPSAFTCINDRPMPREEVRTDMTYTDTQDDIPPPQARPPTAASWPRPINSFKYLSHTLSHTMWGEICTCASDNMEALREFSEFLVDF